MDNHKKRIQLILDLLERFPRMQYRNYGECIEVEGMLFRPSGELYTVDALKGRFPLSTIQLIIEGANRELYPSRLHNPTPDVLEREIAKSI